MAQIEVCLNSRPLPPLTSADDEGIEVLTPGHFLIGWPIEALPDHSEASQPLTLLKRWHLCQALVRHFWTRWTTEYLATLQRLSKWQKLSSSKISVGDVVVIREDETIPGRWPLARVTKTHPGKDGVVRVITIKTGDGKIYTRPIVKAAPPHTVKTKVLANCNVGVSVGTGNTDSLFLCHVGHLARHHYMNKLSTYFCCNISLFN